MAKRYPQPLKDRTVTVALITAGAAVLVGLIALFGRFLPEARPIPLATPGSKVDSSHVTAAPSHDTVHIATAPATKPGGSGKKTKNVVNVGGVNKGTINQANQIVIQENKNP